MATRTRTRTKRAPLPTEWITVHAAAQRTGLTQRRITHLLRGQKVRTLHLPGDVHPRIDANDLERVIRDSITEPEPVTANA